MKSLGEDPAMLPIAIDADGTVRVEEEPIGRVEGLRFTVDHAAGHADRKMLLAAAEKALPRLLGERAEALARELAPGAAGAGLTQVTLARGALRWDEQVLATLAMRDGSVRPVLEPSREVAALPASSRTLLMAALEGWLDTKLTVLEPLAKLKQAARDPEAGSQARALLLNLIAGHGFVSREEAGIEHLPKEMRPFLRRIGVTFGALDIFAPALLKPAPRQLLAALGLDRRPLEPAMLPVIAGTRKLPAGYRHAGSQAIRVDLAEKIFRAAHDTRAKAQGAERRGKFVLDLALPISIGLEPANAERLLGQAGFRVEHARPLAEGAFGPPRPHRWSWRPARRQPERAPPAPPAEGGAFAELAKLMR